MKATEFMIGDWVHCHMQGCRGHVVDFINLSDEEAGADGEIYELDGFEPIPLTPEILKLNGFEVRGGLFTCNGICMSWWKDNVFLFSKYTRHEDIPTENVSVVVRYVHELQHALKLCRIEKEIEL